MKLKRILSGIIGLPIVALILICGNIYVIDVFFALVAIITIHEYFDSFKGKYKPVKWVGYLSCILIAFIHIFPKEYLLYTVAIYTSSIITILFIQVVLTGMKTSVIDIMITFFGICYIVFFLSFIPLLHGMEKGKYLIWFILIAAWGTDTCAYFVGSRFGKHKFTKISPKKSIEGCVGGTIGALVITLIYIFAINKLAGLKISYTYITLIRICFKCFKSNRRFISIKYKKNNENKRFWKLNSRAWRNA